MSASVVSAVFSGGFPSHFHTWLLSSQNLKRVAEVWMDEYAEYIYQRRPEYRHLSAGDVAAQKELRNNLNCKSFKWFMNEVAWDLPKFYPPVEPPAAAWGEASLCSISAMGKQCRLMFQSCFTHVLQFWFAVSEVARGGLIHFKDQNSPTIVVV